MIADESSHEDAARIQLAAWRARILKPPGRFENAARGMQQRVNRAIPEKLHATVTTTIETMTRAILTGADIGAMKPVVGADLAQRETMVAEKIKAWSATASAEGGITGAGGFLMAAADFPALIAIKLKLLFDIAAIYGHSVRQFDERLYILHIFELAFSSAEHRAGVLAAMEDWDARAAARPADFSDFDWRKFQIEYRDHIDLAKLAQMLPVVGAPVGAFVNYRLLNRLGETAINAYRMRWFGAVSEDVSPSVPDSR